MLNTTLANAIAAVVASSANNQWTITVTFLSTSDPSYSFSPLDLDGVKIVQDAPKSHMDSVLVKFPLAMNDYANMYDHMQDLHAVIKMVYCDSNGHQVITTPPIVKRYVASIIDPKDVRKHHTDVQYRTQEFDMSTEVKLTEETAYLARANDFHGICQSATVEDAIRVATDAFGISKCTITPVDNTHLWDHIVVPANRSFADFYSWLQFNYGVYMAGMRHYFTDDHLFVYAPYDTTPTTEKTLIVYQAQKGLYAGKDNYARIKTDTVEVVTNEITKVSDKATYGSENVGTSMVFLRSSEMVDGVVQHDPVQGIKFNDDVVLNLSLQNPKTLRAGANKTVYTKSTDNPWILSSKMLSTQATLLRFCWHMSTPYVLRPGLAVVYYSDNGGKMVKRTGIIEAMEMLLVRMEQGSGGRLYKATANVEVRLQPFETEVTSIS